MKLKFLSLGVLVLFILACGSSSNSEPTSTPQQSAWYACTTFIQQQLDVSARDAQDYTSSGVETLANNQFRVQVFYAEQNSIFLCELERHSNGDMELLSLSVK
jgi:hypothetical protein